MVGKMESNASDALNLYPLDLLICENCGFELRVPPDANNRIVCGKCNTVMDKSHFSPLTRKQKLWVSEKGLKLRLERHAKPLHFSCVGHYRSVIRFRQAVFGLYKKRDKITLVQAMGILISFFIDTEEGILKLPGETRDLLLDWLASMQIKRGTGRPPRSDSLSLFLDAMMLMFCPNAYDHLLRDALRLRAQEYYEAKGDYAMAHRERWDRFWKAKRAVEVGCKRMWREAFNQNPEPHSENWWGRVARQQGLMG